MDFRVAIKMKTGCSKFIFVAASMFLLMGTALADIGPYSNTRTDSVAVLSWFIYIVAVALVIALLTGGERDEKEAVRILHFLVFGLGAVVFFVDFLYGILLILLWIIGEALGRAIATAAVPYRKKIKNQQNIVFFLLIIIVLAQFNFVGSERQGSDRLVTTGFIKIQPLTPSIAYRNTSFTASFTNALGNTINLTDITMNETISLIPCNLVKPSPAIPSNVKVGGTFTLTGVCPQKKDGEAYDMLISIKYNATMGGITTNHRDTGHIKGEADAP